MLRRAYVGLRRSVLIPINVFAPDDLCPWRRRFHLQGHRGWESLAVIAVAAHRQERKRHYHRLKLRNPRLELGNGLPRQGFSPAVLTDHDRRRKVTRIPEGALRARTRSTHHAGHGPVAAPPGLRRRGPRPLRARASRPGRRRPRRASRRGAGSCQHLRPRLLGLRHLLRLQRFRWHDRPRRARTGCRRAALRAACRLPRRSRSRRSTSQNPARLIEGEPRLSS